MNKWLQGHILKSVGPLSYLIKLNDGRIFRRHVDHLQECFIQQTPDYAITDSIPVFSDVSFPDHRYPQRDRRPPDRYRP